MRSPRDFSNGGVRCAICAARDSRDRHVTTAHDPHRLHRPGRLRRRARRRPRQAATTSRGPAPGRGHAGAAQRARRGPDGSGVVRSTRWRYRADPDNRGLDRGWAATATGAGARSRCRTRRTPRRTAARRAGARTPAASAGTPARSRRRSTAATRCTSSPRTTARTVYVDGELRAQPHRRLRAVLGARRCSRRGRHTVAVRVDWRDPRRQADEDWQRAWFNYGGLHRPVTLSRLGPSQLGALHVRTRLRSGDRRAASTSACACATAARARAHPRCAARCRATARRVPLRFGAVTVGRGRSRTVRASVVVDDPALWSPASPDRYDAARRPCPARRRSTGWSACARSRGTAAACYVNGDPLVAARRRPARRRARPRRRDDRRRRGRARRRGCARSARTRRARSCRSSQSMLDAPRRGRHLRLAGDRPVGAGRPLARDDAGDDRRGARPRAARRRGRLAHPSILAWTLTNEAPGQGIPAQQEYVASTARRLHAADPGRPVAADLWGSLLPRSDGLLFDELDAIGVTDYIGWYEGPASAPRPGGARVRAHRAAARPLPGQAARRHRARRGRQPAHAGRRVRRPATSRRSCSAGASASCAASPA